MTSKIKIFEFRSEITKPFEKYFFIMVESKNKLLGVIFFDIKLLLQPDVVFDSESNGCNFSSLAQPGCEKKYFQFFFTK